MNGNLYGRYALIIAAVCCALLMTAVPLANQGNDGRVHGNALNIDSGSVWGLTSVPNPPHPYVVIQPGPSNCKDTFVSSQYPDDNYGSSGNLMVGYYSASSGKYITLIQFPLDSIPTGSTITGASLYLYCDYYYGSAITGRAWQIDPTTDWSEMAVTWNNLPSASGSPVDISLGMAGWYVWSGSTVTSWIQYWINGAQNNGFWLNSGSGTTNGYARFISGDNTASPTLRPYLAVSYTPPSYTITFHTNPSSGGTITFDGSSYSDGDSVSKPAGTYSVSANPASGYLFSSWSRTGGVSTPSGGTTIISGDGSLTANFVDNEPPTVSITYPTNGATVSRSILVTATASDNVGVVRVEFWLDGAPVGSDDTTPYEWIWDTSTATNIGHTIEVKAYDAQNNQGTDQVSVIVDNSGVPEFPMFSVILLCGSMIAEASVVEMRKRKKR